MTVDASDSPDQGRADLAADEARYVAFATELADAIGEAVPRWIERVATQRLRGAGIAVDGALAERVRLAGVHTRAAVEPGVRAVLTADVDAGAGNPLAVLRSGLGPATELLRDLGVAPRRRDDFAVRHFPDDVYDLAPASFADVDEALHEPGLVWGAARAHVHLRRRPG